MSAAVCQWAKNGHVVSLVWLLLSHGFSVALASDHGNVHAHGIGRPNLGSIPDDRGQRAVKLFCLGEVDEEWMKNYCGPIKAMKESYKAELEALESQRTSAAELSTLASQLDTYCARFRHNLDEFTLEDKRMALNALQVRAIVTESEVQVKGILGVETPSPDILTIEQTSA